MFIIGLIDDNERELDDIQATITTGWQKTGNISGVVDFKIYKLAADIDFKEKLQAELINDVQCAQIHGLIVDYKLDSLRKVFAGKDIADYLHQKVPAFPVVVLTNVPERGKEEDEIDPDKVYDKEVFFNLDESLSRELVFNIRRNVERYVKQRAELEALLSQALEELNQDNNSDEKIELLARITELEDHLNDYTQTGMTSAEKAFDLGNLKDLVANLIQLESDL